MNSSVIKTNEENIYEKENHFIAFNHVQRFGESRKKYQ
ncbi:hypothetical protein RV13_GL002163 [Enterococcus raffinosus]|nr:hypothetical protein RV13_GL002163 [Enterococcus raffinosus]